MCNNPISATRVSAETGADQCTRQTADASIQLSRDRANRRQTVSEPQGQNVMSFEAYGPGRIILK